jgi:hypothetical protein
MNVKVTILQKSISAFCTERKEQRAFGRSGLMKMSLNPVKCNSFLAGHE